MGKKFKSLWSNQSPDQTGSSTVPYLSRSRFDDLNPNYLNEHRYVLCKTAHEATKRRSFAIRTIAKCSVALHPKPDLSEKGTADPKSLSAGWGILRSS